MTQLLYGQWLQHRHKGIHVVWVCDPERETTSSFFRRVCVNCHTQPDHLSSGKITQLSHSISGDQCWADNSASCQCCSGTDRQVLIPFLGGVRRETRLSPAACTLLLSPPHAVSAPLPITAWLPACSVPHRSHCPGHYLGTYWWLQSDKKMGKVVANSAWGQEADCGTLDIEMLLQLCYLQRKICLKGRG